MHDDFCQLLKRLVRTAFKSRRAFIRAAESPERENSASAYLSKVLKGEAPPPLERIESWADALKLSGKERERFLDLAVIGHLPDSSRVRILQMYERFQQQEMLIAALEAKLKIRGR